MIVSPQLPFRIVYSIDKHPYLGYVIEPFVVQLSDKQKFTYKHQKISSSNAKEFESGLKEKDFLLIDLMDEIRVERIFKHYRLTKLPVKDCLNEIFEKRSNSKLTYLKNEIINYVVIRIKKILQLFDNEFFYRMDAKGEPIGKRISKLSSTSSITFNFHKNENNTHYYPQIISNKQKILLHKHEVSIICDYPAWVIIDKELHHFNENFDAKKLAPFLKKKFVLIPQKVEKMYYQRFILRLIQDFEVRAYGFNIVNASHKLKVRLRCVYIPNDDKKDLFGNVISAQGEKIQFTCEFWYGNMLMPSKNKNINHVHLNSENEKYTFYKVKRKRQIEEGSIQLLKERELDLITMKKIVPLADGLHWIKKNEKILKDNEIELVKDAFLAENLISEISKINIKIEEKIDWFDLMAEVKIGTCTFKFADLKSLVAERKSFIDLPDGTKAFIPKGWFDNYEELFVLAEKGEKSNVGHLKKYHLGLIQRLYSLASEKSDIHRLKQFSKIEDCPLPKGLKGELRSYQKAGYNWLNFLNNYGLGGCLADDMGLGKTIQTLALIQFQKEKKQTTSLLIVPTSLIHNWVNEARQFTPKLSIFLYVGKFREKAVDKFNKYDLIITSYGVLRRDISHLSKYIFNYIILDESQAIKNPNSSTTIGVKQLSSKLKLCITGTPLENTTIDLWSQMDFLNKGLLGNLSYFKKNFHTPIEKKGSQHKAEKFVHMIKPFLLRRHKSQVLSELPEKVENVRYVEMSEKQATYYHEKKEEYKQLILSNIKENGMQHARFRVLQGLTKLRLIANHPLLDNESYIGNSGKFDMAMDMTKTVEAEGNKILIFSQFAKHLSLIKKKLIQEKISYCYLDGRTKNRQYQVDTFQKDDSIKVFLISLKAGGVGLNLTKAEYVFILDPWWNPAIEAQAIDRAHRIGQKNNVMAYKFISKNTVEEKIILLQQKKKNLSDQLVATEQSFIKQLTAKDIELLFD